MFFLIVITFSNLTHAQFTSIPDANFEQELINLGYDTGSPNGTVLTANINTITSLDVDFKNISDLTGIEDFSALTSLWCQSNLLTNLNVSQNTSLINLSCHLNQITSLDITQNTALTFLRCQFNLLTSLDVTQNTALTFLDVLHNQITSLDLSQNTVLEELICFENQLSSLDLTQNIVLTALTCKSNLLNSLDLSQNTSLTWLDFANNQLTCLNLKNGNNSNLTLYNGIGNPNLTCIEVDNVPYSNTNWTNIDAQTSFSTNCPSSCSTVGLNEYHHSNFNIYPNPALEQLTIDTELAIRNVSILDITGKIITMTSQQSKLIDVVDLPSGIYFIKVITEEETMTKKFMKQ